MLNPTIIHAALAATGKEMRVPGDVELLVIGGAAGLLTRELPDSIATGDVDTVEFRPPGEVEEVLRAAAIVGQQQGLPANWLNIEAGLFAHDLPEGWRARRVFVGRFGPLLVYALGRLDLIAMKFFAHRTHDRVHLSMMRVNRGELEFVRAYLAKRSANDAARAAHARAYVDSWEAVP